MAAISEKTGKAAEVLDRARRCSEENDQGNHLHIHNPVDDLAASASRGNIIAMIQHALETNSFRLLFQPVISLRGEQDELYEVLLRLVTPRVTKSHPMTFSMQPSAPVWPKKSTAGCCLTPSSC